MCFSSFPERAHGTFQALKGVEGEVTSRITRSSDEDNPVSNSLDLTFPNIFSNLATLAEQETRGNKKERTKLYRQSSPTTRLTHLGHSPSITLSKQPKQAKRKAIEGKSNLTEE